MNAEVVLAAAYAGALVLGAFGLEWLSAHTHRRALRYRTAGFTYDATHDHWPGSCSSRRAPAWPGRGNVRLSRENAGC